MADIKHHFCAGRMNKDLDERLVPNGEYRDAQNIEIVTSEGSSVGSIQNVLGNTLKDGRNFDNSTSILTNWGSNSSSIKDLTNPKCIGYVVDPQNDKVYWFISAGSTATAQVNGSSTDTTPVLDNNSGTIVVGMTVRDISGKAIANLNYEKINHHGPVFIGDTINTYSKIISKEISQSNKHNAKIKIMTVAQNQKKEKVLSFYRTILIKK